MTEALFLAGMFLVAAATVYWLRFALDPVPSRRRSANQSVEAATHLCAQAQERARRTGTLADYIRWRQGLFLREAAVALTDNRYDLAETLKQDAAFLGKMAAAAEGSERRPTFMSTN